MSTNFLTEKCWSSSNLRRFGICDDTPPPSIPAYLNEIDGKKWIAVVHNDRQIKVEFVAIDNCIEFSKRDDGKDKKRCDGALFYEDTVIFVELKDIVGAAKNWADPEQLMSAIAEFETTGLAKKYSVKRAHLVNKQRPVFDRGQAVKINTFFKQTGYELRLNAHIDI